MSAPVVWFEVLGQNPDKLRGFYGELFGWKFNTDNPMGYGMVEKPEKGIPGGVGQAPPGAPGWTTFYVGVEDLEGALKRAQALGGKVLLPATKIMDGTIAVIADPEGHPIGLATG